MLWKFLKFIGGVVKTFFWLALILALAGIVLLYILEQDIPAPLVRRMSDALTSDDYLCRIGRASFKLKSGLHLYQVKAFPKRVADTALASADEIAIAFSLQPQLALGERIRGVTVKNISVPSFPPKSKKPDSVPSTPPQTSNTEPKYEKAAPRLPTIAPFPLTVEKANILGLQAERLSAMVAMEDPQISVTQVAILWPDKAFTMNVEGGVSVNFASRLVDGRAKGQAFPANILPLLVALHSRGAIKQIDNFSKIERPIDADAAFTVNIDNSDFFLHLVLDVGPCAYRGVPMKYAKGTLDAFGTNVNTTVVVGPVQAESSTGPLAGKLVYREENESVELDATSGMDIQQLITIADILRHGELKPIRCDALPTITVKGIVAADSKKSTVTNDLSGHIDLPAGSIFNLPVRNVSSDLAVKGDSALFDHVCCTTPSGGKLSGNIAFFYPGGSATSTLFSTRATFANIELSELSHTFNFATNARAGVVSGNLSLVGHASNHTIPSLVGEGNVRIRDGMLNRMPLFAGFTDYLARNIPGVSALVNQSSGSMDFAIEEGVLHTDDLLVEGDLFSLRGRGTCNLDTEALDFVVRANIFKEKTFAGRITHLVTLPFTRLLLEFKVFGTLSKTNWSYVSIIEKITGGLTDLSSQFKATPSPPRSTRPSCSSTLTNLYAPYAFHPSHLRLSNERPRLRSGLRPAGGRRPPASSQRKRSRPHCGQHVQCARQSGRQGARQTRAALCHQTRAPRSHHRRDGLHGPASRHRPFQKSPRPRLFGR